MNIEILGSAYFPAKTLQNELCLMRIGQSSQKIRSFEVEVNIAPNVNCVFQTALLKNKIMRHKPYFLRAYHKYLKTSPNSTAFLFAHYNLVNTVSIMSCGRSG